MERTHYAINYSDACDRYGDGNCEGFVDEGEGNENAISDECTCPCHSTNEVLPLTTAGMKEWHDEWHGVDIQVDAHLDDMGD